MLPIRRILLATDFSQASEAAAVQAVALAADNGAELVIAHAFEPPIRPAVDAYLIPRIYDEFEAELRSEADRQLAPLVERAQAARVKVRPLVVRGAPDAAICRAAREENADLIVVGTHGRSGIARLFLGSVAARIVSSATCPVLTVRAVVTG